MCIFDKSWKVKRVKNYAIMIFIFSKSFAKFFYLFLASAVTCRTALAFINSNDGVTFEANLYNHLTKIVPKYFPPVDMLNNSVYIYSDLYKILNVDEKQGFLTAKLFIHIWYQSDGARWNISLSRGVKYMLFPLETFWTADISKILE